MHEYSRTHLGDEELLRSAILSGGRERNATAAFLADLAEVDSRQLYRQAGYSSMHAYCVDVHHLSDDEAYKRIQAARVALQFPVLFKEMESGRLHLTAVRLLAPHLCGENVGELIAAAGHRSRPELERFLADRFSNSRAISTTPMIRAIPTRSIGLAPGQVETCEPDLLSQPPALELAPGQVEAGVPSLPNDSQGSELAPGPVAASRPESPRAPKLFLLKAAISEDAHDDLRAIQDLLGHAVPSGDLGEVLRRALKFYRAHLQERRFGATRKPRPTKSKRHVSAHVRNAVWERDGGRCTFESDSGRRCAATKQLEFDHIDPVARGGVATADNLRLRCRAHNQLEAERVFGAEFMQQKRTSRRASPSPFRSPHPPGPPPPAYSSRVAGTPARAP